MAEQVDADPTEQVAAQGAQLTPDDIPDALLKGYVPGGASRHGDREGGSPMQDHAPGAIGETNARDTQTRDGAGIPGVVAVSAPHHLRQPAPKGHVPFQHGEFFVQGELGQ